MIWFPVLHHRVRCRLPLMLLSVCISIATSAFARSQIEDASWQPWNQWLRLGPVAVHTPAFGEHPMAESSLNPSSLWPSANEAVSWPGAGEVRWESLYVGGGRLTLGSRDLTEENAAELWLAAYIGVDRFTQLALQLDGGSELALWLDGETIAIEPAAHARKAKLALTTGDHLVLLRCFRPRGPGGWELDASWRVEAGDVKPKISVRSQRRLGLGDLIDTEEIEGLEVSPDGQHLAVRYVSPSVPAPHTTRWIEIRRSDTGALVRTTRGTGNFASFAWSPSGDRFAFVERRGEAATLWVEDLAGSARTRIADGLEHFGGFRWMPTGEGFVIAIASESPADPRGVKLLRGLTDRWTGARDLTQLFELSMQGVRRRLTAGPLSCELMDISPDGKRLVLERAHLEMPPRERAESELCELALEDLSLRPLARTAWFQSARYDPAGERLLLLAGPSAFQGVGRRVPEGVIANDYDTQAYVMDLGSRAVQSISKEADLTIEWAAWHAEGKQVCARITAGSYSKHAIYDFDAQSWSDLPRAGEVASISSCGGEWLASVASGAVEPAAIYVQPTSASSSVAPRLLLRPMARAWSQVRLGTAANYPVTLASGQVIDGYVLLPVDFDPSRRYPCIVNYYAGTAPVSREFAGRYPKSWWAAQGYVVYVLQPSGATGFGQEFSARHVNNWGRITTSELIEGVQQFLGAHTYVDPERVGCIGASYGGFSTLLLISHTELFAGAISHAGISSLSSYWGEGWWGAQYSAVASANSFPWNARDLYVDQSALFRADQIKTPLLLIHGTVDTNVPLGESDQMFTALRTLGREVEYLRVEGENHHVVSYAKRKLWMQSIVAWFDRTLKSEPQWWEHLYQGRG